MSSSQHHQDLADQVAVALDQGVAAEYDHTAKATNIEVYRLVRSDVEVGTITINPEKLLATVEWRKPKKRGTDGHSLRIEGILVN
jgi:hypothetical protein